ncbi:uncharacterized protein CBL_04938 [Carabus blaptoides fortunei]
MSADSDLNVKLRVHSLETVLSFMSVVPPLARHLQLYIFPQENYHLNQRSLTRRTPGNNSDFTMLTYVAAFVHLILLVSGQPVDTDKSGAYKDVEDALRTRRIVSSPVTRAKRTTDHIITDCMTVVSSEGHYFYKSPNEDDTVCGIYFFTEPDHTVEIYFNYLDVPCEDSGLVSYRIPRRGAGFSFIVRFLKNRTPCNVLLQDTEGVYTLRNYGKRVNCSISAIFPAAARVLSISVGLVGGHSSIAMETGTIHKCQKRGLDDYVQIGGSDGLDTSNLYVAESLCGIDSKPGTDHHIIFCGVTTVRLVSSGSINNMSDTGFLRVTYSLTNHSNAVLK